MFRPADSSLNVKTSVARDQVRVVLRGTLDLATTDRLEAAVAAVRPLSAPLVVDLGGVSFIDSTGLRSLLAVRQHSLADTGIPLTLSGMTPSVAKLLEISGLGSLFHRKPDAPA